jgi:hypothetical protein
MASHREIDFRYAPGSSWTCIGRPDDPHKTLVDERGRLLYGYERDGARFGVYRFRQVVEFALVTDASPLRVTQQTPDVRVPLVVTEIHYPHAVLTLQAIGHQDDGGQRTDVVLWEIRPAPNQSEIVSGLWLQVQALDRRLAPAGLAPSAYVYAHPLEDAPRWRGLADLFVAHEDLLPAHVDRALFLISPGHPLQVASAYDHGPASGLATELAVVSQAHPRRGAICFPQEHRAIDGIAGEWAQAAVAAEQRFWRAYPLNESLRIPDLAIDDMLTACARNLVQAREIKNGLPEFQVGPTVYRGLWIIDGYFFLEAAQFLGWHEDARRAIDALLRRAKPSGAIEERSLDMKDTGLALATLVRQCEMSGDRALLRQLWPTLQRAVDYLRSLRTASHSRGPDAPEFGLLPPAFGNGGLGGVRPEYTTALWLLTGLQAVVRAAGYLDLAEEQASIQAEFDDLMQTLRTKAERDRATLADGTPYWPMSMPGSGAHHWIHDHPQEPPPWARINPATGTWALAHAVYPGELFAPDDPLVTDFCRLLDQIDDEQGIPAATGWLPYAAAWTYAASFYAYVWLYAGRSDKAVDYLYAFANHASPTRVWREEQSLAAAQLGQKVGDMPHNWASAEFIRLVRNFLVFERGDALELLPALPEPWLRQRERLRVQTPTRFGDVRLELSVDESRDAVLEIEVETNGLAALRAVTLHVPKFETVRLQTVRFQGRPVPSALIEQQLGRSLTLVVDQTIDTAKA